MVRMTLYYWCYISMLVFLLSGVSLVVAGETLPPKFKVGSILPLSGDLASLGQEMKRGMLLAIDDFSESKRPIELIFEDDYRLDAGALVHATQKLLNVDRVDLGLTLWLDESKHIAPIFINKKQKYLYYVKPKSTAACSK